MTSKDLRFVEDIHTLGLDVNNRTIYVGSEHENDGEEAGTDYKMAIKLIKNLDILNSISDKDIVLKMLNPGGDWAYGMAMYDAIKKSVAKVVCIVTGYVTSMGSIVPQACNERLITSHSNFMIHYGSYNDSGNFIQVKSGLDYSTTLNKIMLDIYVEKCLMSPFSSENNMTKKKVENFIKNKLNRNIDWWMSAEESVYYGFMDSIA